MTDAEALARLIKNDARNIRDVLHGPGPWRHETLCVVVKDCAVRLFEAEAKAPGLIEEALKNLHKAVNGYKRLTSLT